MVFGAASFRRAAWSAWSYASTRVSGGGYLRPTEITAVSVVVPARSREGESNGVPKPGCGPSGECQLGPLPKAEVQHVIVKNDS